MAFGLQSGLFERLDFYTRLQMNTPFMYGLKMQILGRPRSEAEYEGHSMSLFMSFGRMRYIDNSENNLSQTKSGDYEYNRAHSISEFGLAYGYRLYSDILVYSRLKFQREVIVGEINYEENSNLDGESVKFSGSHTHLSAGSIWYTKNLNLGFELHYSMFKMKDESLTIPSMNILIGRDF
jgi:hypothetical protein